MPFREDIQKKIIDTLSPHVKVVSIDFEGPSIVVLIDDSRKFYTEGCDKLIKQLAKDLKKHLIIRCDPRGRLRKSEAEKKIHEILRNIVGEDIVDSIYFDELLGDVYIYLKRPIRNKKKIEHTIFAETGWRAIITPTALEMARRLPRQEIEYVRQIQIAMAKERAEFLRALGRRIHRDPVFRDTYVRITVLGAGFEVGRSAILIQTRESSVLLDCGIKPGYPHDEYPFLDVVDIDRLDAVVISHAHMDHVGFVPFLYKYGYKGPVYMTEPTKYLMEILVSDYIELCEREGKQPPFSKKDLTTALYHTITIDYDDTTDIAPDIKLTFSDAGHEIGSAISHLHIGNGLYNIVYTGDFKYGPTRLLNVANKKFKRVELLIMESTYGGKNDIQESRDEAERRLIDCVRKTIERGGKVLIPAFSTGRAQELLLILNDAVERKLLPKTMKIYVDGMILETLNVHLMFPDYLNRNVRELIYDGVNPFLSDNVEPVERPKRPEKRYEQVMSIVKGDPCVILAPHGMLNGGPILDYFVHLADDERSTLLFVSYQAENTLGRRILQGERKLTLKYYNEEVKVEVRMNVESIQGFSGHSDRRQLLAYVRDVEPRPSKIVLVHGEQSKILSLALTIELSMKIPVLTPGDLESIRLVP
ncbi:MAG: beta-CASP ribonuclease aCPSF1 [Crenarchaeota archaeon]|nr:beta-CASP ribonuclease aCPSF1 [Thermoproteota archaeon]